MAFKYNNEYNSGEVSYLTWRPPESDDGVGLKISSLSLLSWAAKRTAAAAKSRGDVFHATGNNDDDFEVGCTRFSTTTTTTTTTTTNLTNVVRPATGAGIAEGSMLLPK
jgi:hypothetical protein